MKRTLPFILLLALACTATIYEGQVSDTLYFGTARPDGTVVTVEEWQRFLHEVVVPRFPAFTILEAQGEWKGNAEATHVMVIVHPRGDEAKIVQIIDEYKRRFQQESVLQVREDVWIPRR